MWWGVCVAVIFAAWLFVRWGGRDIRFVAKTVGKALNVRPHIIEAMVVKMGQDRSSMLAKQLRAWPDAVMPDAAATVFIFQIAKNGHPENVKWWRKQLVDAGFTADLDLESVETAFMYLRGVDEAFDVDQTSNFLAAYNHHMAAA